MLITRVEQGNEQRYRVYADSEFLFALYKRELTRYQIEVGQEVDESFVQDILDNVIFSRAKERALYLVERGMYTCYTMRAKLRGNDYPEYTIELVIQWLLRYHFLDDAAYVRAFVETYGKRKSKRQMMLDLNRKGIAKDLIQSYFEEQSEQSYSEESCFQRQFERYVCGKDLRDIKLQQKTFRYFYGKGFANDMISRYIRQYIETLQYD